MRVWASQGRCPWFYCPQNTRGTSRSAAITVADTTSTPNATHTNTMSKRTLSSLCDAQFSIALNTPIAFAAYAMPFVEMRRSRREGPPDWRAVSPSYARTRSWGELLIG